MRGCIRNGVLILDLYTNIEFLLSYKGSYEIHFRKILDLNEIGAAKHFAIFDSKCMQYEILLSKCIYEEAKV